MSSNVNSTGSTTSFVEVVRGEIERWDSSLEQTQTRSHEVIIGLFDSMRQSNESISRLLASLTKRVEALEFRSGTAEASASAHRATVSHTFQEQNRLYEDVLTRLRQLEAGNKQLETRIKLVEDDKQALQAKIEKIIRAIAELQTKLTAQSNPISGAVNIGRVGPLLGVSLDNRF